MVKIEKVSPDGPLGPSTVAPGDQLKSINGVDMRDLLDVRFAAAEDQLDLDFVRPDGSGYAIDLEKHPDDDLGLVFEPMPIRACNNHCDFCFVFQQPKKTMRRDLYIMDDDYRYSFLYGSFITLTNIDESDIERIFEQRLSPLYISVHCTTDSVRREFLRSPDAMPIMPLLRKFAEAGIQMHTQIVVVPDFNDGKVLDQTINDLASLYPAVQSLAVVPVGLTRFRLDLPNVSVVSKSYAQKAVKRLRGYGAKFRSQMGVEFCYVADEFFVLAGLPFPRAPYYDDFQQIENGIGMSRDMLDHFAQKHSTLPRRLDRPLTLYWVTGTSAWTFLESRIIEPLNQIENLTIKPVVVVNQFYGDSVTVSGLLTGSDIVRSVADAKREEGLVILPPNCINDEMLFLDDLSVHDVSSQLHMPVIPSRFDFVPLLRSILLSPQQFLKVKAA
jgi:putative radical SAM enzyme (TIGR03279 family)